MIVVATMYVPRALDFSSFPTILLLTTLFRLAINVSVTRLILLEGDAGHVVEAFGNFVVGGNIVVGLVVFLILIVIQFVVITNGAGRVAEVGARFTLDAMPGKQMAIDADLNTGQITDEEARIRRAEVAQEADFYGAMDGASKFVKGDAMAGILITAHQPARRHRHRRGPAGHAVRRGRPPLLAAVDRRRPLRPDPGAADLGRHRHPRDPLRGLGQGPRLDGLHADPRPAQGAARRRRDGHGLRPRPGPPEAPVLRHRRAVLRRRLEPAQQADHPRAGSARQGRRPSRHNEQAPAAGSARRRAGRAAGRPARAGDRLRPGPARRQGRRRNAAGPRRHDPPPDRLRARRGHPAGPHPRRRRPGLARVRHARAWLRSCTRRRDGRAPYGDEPGRRHGAAARHPDHRAGLRPPGGLDPRESAAPRPRPWAGPWSTPSRSSSPT